MATLWVGGATGFIGSHVVRALRERGDAVIGVSRGGGRVHDVTVLPVDLCDADAVRQSAEGASAALVAAGKVSRDPADAAELHRLHVIGTRNALRGLREAGVRRVVYASTSGTIAVGTDARAVYDESHPTPLEILATLPYYRSKHYAELEALEANDPPDFEVVVVNPSLVLGPGDERGSSTDDVRRFLERSIPAVPSGGLAFVDVRDVATAMLSALEAGRPGERYLLSAQNLTVSAFFSRLERITGVPAPRLRMPRSPALSTAAHGLFSRAVRALGGEPPVDETSARMGQLFWYCDPAKAERELGFTPRDPGDTLRDTVQDLLDRGVAVPRDADRRAAAAEIL
jgi:dihydroflavonol-4-reductase